MAAAKITGTYPSAVPGPVRTVRITKVTQNDWVLLPDPGGFIVASRNYNGTPETLSNKKVDAVHDTSYAATDTAIVYDGAAANTRSAGGFYILNATSGEIMYVSNDSGYTTTTGTMTVRRGCLGTAAAAIANNAELYILNSWVLGSATTGPTELVYIPLPADPAVKIYG
jgi:hypothetical protein